MILELPRLTKKQYDARKDDFYKKPGIPTIELELEECQKELLLKGNFSILPKFHEKLAVYAKSLLLQTLQGSSDFIEPPKVEELADQAADNFIKRYFRTEDPVVGASFAGILQFKVKEVRSIYFKSTAVESNVSLDTEFGDSSNNTLTVEQLLAFKDYEIANSSFTENYDIDDCIEDITTKIEKELELLKGINLEKNLDRSFLQYLIYLYILQSSRMDKKLTTVSGQALKLIANEDTSIERLTPIMESALLDIVEKVSA